MPFVNSIRATYGSQGDIFGKYPVVNPAATTSSSGGTITTAGGYRIHTFTSSGAINIVNDSPSRNGTKLSNGSVYNTSSPVPVEYLLVGGGAPGAAPAGGRAGEVLSGTANIVGSNSFTVAGVNGDTTGFGLVADNAAGATGASGCDGRGSNGTTSSISGTSTVYAGGGGGGGCFDGGYGGPGGPGGSGGGGRGGVSAGDIEPPYTKNCTGGAATFYGGGGGGRGNGGGDTGCSGSGGAGYQGIVIVRYQV